MNNKELELNKGIEIIDCAKGHEKKSCYDQAAKEYKKARDILKNIGQNKLSAKCLAAHVANVIKYHLWPRDIEPSSKDLPDYYIKKLDGIKSLELSKFDKNDILITVYRELEKVFAGCHMVEEENKMYYKRMCLYHKYYWQKSKQKNNKFFKKIFDKISSVLYFYLFIFCGHGEKPKRALGWIIVYIFIFSVLFKLCNLIKFVDPEKTLCFWQSLYFSVITFTTLGYGDIVPIDTAGQITVIIEVTLGVLSLGLLLASLTRKFTK